MLLTEITEQEFFAQIDPIDAAILEAENIFVEYEAVRQAEKDYSDGILNPNFEKS